MKPEMEQKTVSSDIGQGSDSIPPSETVNGNTDVFSLDNTDPILSVKMHLVNNAIDEIGFTPYHAKLFCLTGFGYAVDSMLLLVPSIVAVQADKEFSAAIYSSLNIAMYSGLLVGAIFWGFSADMIGRRLAFNISLLGIAIFALVAGAAPNWVGLASLVAFTGFFGGGNYIFDIAIFLEYVPSKYQWLLTGMATWWGIGQTIAGLVAWPLMSYFSCESAETCTRSNNMGWRYLWFTLGGFVFVLSILRVTLIRLQETPKFLLTRQRDAEVIEELSQMSKKYNRPFTLTLEQLQACGVVETVNEHANISFGHAVANVKGLFKTRKLAISTSMIFLSWTLVGLAYPLFYVFLPTYLASRGAQFGETSSYITWRNYAIANVAGIFGPVLAGFLCEVKFLGRRGTMCVGALLTMAFFFAYTAVKNNEQNLGFTCAIYFCLNIYYGTLYAYTPEVLPSASRATGNGIAVSFARIMGIISSVIGIVSDAESDAPIFICAALFVVMAVISLAFPFEPRGRRSV